MINSNKYLYIYEHIEGDLEDEAFDEDEEEIDEENVEYSEEEIDEIGDEISTGAAGSIEKLITAPKTFEELNSMFRTSTENKTDHNLEPSLIVKEDLNKDNEKDKNDSEVGNNHDNEDGNNAEYDDDEEYEDEDDDEQIDVDEDDEEIDDDDEGEISDVDDNDLMKRLESKYGKLPDVELSEDEDVSEASDDKWTSNYYLLFN